MKRIYSLLLLFQSLVCFSQNFNIKITPERDTLIQGSSINFNLIGIPIDGFNSSIYLSASTSSCIAPYLKISPAILNSPYNNCQINIASTTGVVPGDYTIIVKGENGSLSSNDTCYLHVKSSVSQEWQVFTTENSGITYNSVWDIAVDSSNGYWLAIMYQSGYGNTWLPCTL